MAQEKTGFSPNVSDSTVHTVTTPSGSMKAVQPLVKQSKLTHVALPAASPFHHCNSGTERSGAQMDGMNRIHDSPTYDRSDVVSVHLEKACSIASSTIDNLRLQQALVRKRKEQAAAEARVVLADMVNVKQPKHESGAFSEQAHIWFII